uniref:Endosome-lysosome associated apoptosis and autophagy regulator 1 n=1 Tax=Oncorhynchus kisutch TaxID=8019 RepID=A0A8C7FA04_ONCKI
MKASHSFLHLLWLFFFQIYASSDLPICKESDYHFEYTDCDVLGSRWRVAVPNKPDTCTGLPDPVKGTQCTFSCSEGEFLDMRSQECQKCSGGTYSLGTGVAFDEWDSMPAGFISHGMNMNIADIYTNCSKSPHTVYSTWIPKGDYIASNIDECTSTLSYAVSLKKAGTVSFEYFYPDNTIFFEFYVQNDQCESTDSEGRWMRTSEKDWTPHNLKLNRGNNVLYWRTTSFALVGSAVKPVLLRNIAISGVAYTSECFHCKPGTYSAKPGSAHCTPCPADSYSNKGATVCQQCEVDKYAEAGSGSCKRRPACTTSDYFYTHTPCDSKGQTQLMYKWIEPKICSEIVEGTVHNSTGGAVKLPASGQMETCPPCNPGFSVTNTSGCEPCPHGSYSNGTACAECPVGTEPVVGFEYKWWNKMPDNMRSSVYSREYSDSARSTGWEVAGEYIYTTQGDLDSDYMMLSLTVPGYRLPHSVAKDDERSELSRISFVFETQCTADCTLYFMGYSERTNDMVEHWSGSTRKQSYSYLVKSNSTVSFTWGFQRTQAYNLPLENSNDGYTETHIYEVAVCVDNVTESRKEVRGYACQSTVVPSEVRGQSVVSSQPFTIGDTLIGKRSSFTPWCIPLKYRAPTVARRILTFDSVFVLLSSKCSEGTCDGCSFHFLWRSLYACPLCTESHYREIVSACIQGIQRTTYVWQQPLQCTGGVSLPAQTVSACVTLDFWLKVGVSTGTVAAILLISISCYFWKRTRKLEYKYSKLMMTAGDKECELPAADSCAIMEGEDAEDDLIYLTKKSFFTKIKSFSRERSSDGFDSVPLKSSSGLEMEMS